ncbi:glycosyltransferase family protein [Occultella aeris]|nr:hypothetical protein [Occultella aeris]
MSSTNQSEPAPVAPGVQDHRAPLFQRSTRPARILGLMLGALGLAFVALRLGPSLLGLNVFTGLDLFELFRPWSELPGSDEASSTSVYVSDQLDYFLPAMHEVHVRLLQGDLAMWTSANVGGFPLLGTINYGMISPGRWVFFILPTWLAPAWSKLLEMAFAATFTFLLVRRLGMSKLGAGLAAFIYPMTGFIIAWTNWPQTAVATIIPMLFWSIERFSQERRVRDAVPVAIATALLLFGGFPAVAAQTLYLAGIYALVRTLVRHRRSVRPILRDLAILAGAVVVGVGVTAFQLLPFADQLLGETDLSYREDGFFGVNSRHFMLTTIFPESFSGNYLWSGLSPMDVNSYLGGMVVILAALGVVRTIRGGIPRSVGLFCLGAIVLVVGLIWFQGPWSDWMNNLPFLSGNPIGRMRSQLGLPVALLAAAGIDHLRSDSQDQTRAFTLPTVVTVAAVTLLAGAGAALLVSGRILDISQYAWRDALVAVVPMLALGVLVLIGLRRSWPRWIALALVVVTVPLQAVPATAFYWPTGERDAFFRTSAGIEYLQEHLGHDRIATLGHPIRPNTNQYFGLRTLNGHAFVPEDMAAVLTAIDERAFIGPTYSVLSSAVTQFGIQPGLDRFGVRYLVADAESSYPGPIPAPLAGVEDAVSESSEPVLLEPGQSYEAQIAPGELRGLHIPMTVNEAATVSVELVDADGTIARNEVDVRATTDQVKVPVALTPIDGGAFPDTGDPLTVRVTVDAPVTAALEPDGDLQVLAVRPPVPSDGLELVFAGEGLIIWERPTALPRIRWTSDAIVIPDPAERLDAMANDPAPGGTVILSDAPETPLTGTGSTTELTVVEDSGDTIRVDVTATEPGLVVISDNVENFVATVDGDPVEILSADYAGGAVEVPAGAHQVELTYAPESGARGAAISLVCLVLLAGIGIAPLLRRRIRARGEGRR